MLKATLLDYMGSDLTVVNAARVSFGKKVDTFTERDEKLIYYLAREGHTSPFGHCFASFHVKAPIFVARQLVKHKFLRWNEISRRYVDDEPEFYVPDVWRGRSKDKKQGSEGVVDLTQFTMFENGGIIGPWYLDEEMSEHWGRSLQQYNKLLDAGVAPEQARMVLPQSTMTEWYWSGSLDAFASMYNLRIKPDTQYESRVIAQQIGEQMAEKFPVSWRAITDG